MIVLKVCTIIYSLFLYKNHFSLKIDLKCVMATIGYLVGNLSLPVFNVTSDNGLSAADRLDVE